MKLKLFYSVVALSLLTLISACDDDETPITGIQFEADEQEVTESDGTLASLHPEIEGPEEPGQGRVINVDLVFDRALAGDVVLKFDVSGSASLESNDDELSDYAIVEEADGLTVDGDEITILNGTESASFQIIVYEDLSFEYDDEGDFTANDVPFETVKITLEEIVSGPGRLGEELEHTVKILEDDAVGVLVWAPNDMTDDAAAVDMDLIMWFDEVTWLAGASEGTDFEIFAIPAGLGEGEVGLSYTYYSGNSDDVDFEAGFFNTAGTLEGERFTYGTDDDPLLFGGNYKLINRNQWSSTSLPKVAQTAEKEGIDYSDFSSVQSFVEGSRAKTRVPLTLQRNDLVKAAKLSKSYRTTKLNKSK